MADEPPYITTTATADDVVDDMDIIMDSTVEHANTEQPLPFSTHNNASSSRRGGDAATKEPSHEAKQKHVSRRSC